MTVLPFNVTPTAIDGLLVLQAKQVADERGTVREFFRASSYSEPPLPRLGPWLQVNVTETAHGAVRGLHGEDATKLVGVVHGAAFGAYVDLRPEATSVGRIVTVDLVPGVQVVVPTGVLNGFQATAPGATQYLYCFDREWVPGMSGRYAHPLDPALAIPWPIPIDVDDRAQISEKDASVPFLDSFVRAGS